MTDLFYELSSSIFGDESGEFFEESSGKGGGEVEVDGLVETFLEVLMRRKAKKWVYQRQTCLSFETEGAEDEPLRLYGCLEELAR